MNEILLTKTPVLTWIKDTGQDRGQARLGSKVPIFQVQEKSRRCIDDADWDQLTVDDFNERV